MEHRFNESQITDMDLFVCLWECYQSSLTDIETPVQGCTKPERKMLELNLRLFRNEKFHFITFKPFEQTNTKTKCASREGNSPRWSRDELTSAGLTGRFTGKLEDRIEGVGPRLANSFQVRALFFLSAGRPALQLHTGPSSARSCSRSDSELPAPASTLGIRCNCYS